jgi:hypothetical protein
MFTPAQVLPGASAKHSRVPEFVRTLEVQQPHPGEFTIDDLQWVQTNNRGVPGMVAGFHKDRLDDFVRGECTRGDTAIKRESKGNTALLVNFVCRCKYAAHRKTADKQKAALPINEYSRAPGTPQQVGHRTNSEKRLRLLLHCEGVRKASWPRHSEVYGKPGGRYVCHDVACGPRRPVGACGAEDAHASHC